MRDYLPENTIIYGDNGANYTIKRVIGEGASCVAYEAYGERNNGCIIKEFYPVNINICRDQNGRLLPKGAESEKYKFALECYKDGIKKQQLLRGKYEETNNQIFPLIDQFECNNTYYSVVVEYSGNNYLDEQNISLLDRCKVCKSVALYVKKLHELGYLCLDIKPSNIFTVPETSEFAMFFDFDSVKSKDEVRNGTALSYSLGWAAPEQVLSIGNTQISEQTDIYLLGELLFYSLFDRHSEDEEHRRFSQYPYGDSKFASDITGPIEQLFNEVFHNTLRSSSRNRYKSVDCFIKKLNCIIDEINRLSNRIINILRHNKFFVGREKEVEKIRRCLLDKNRVIIKGMGGIGKTELVIKYANKFSKEYKNIVFLSYDFDLVSTIKNHKFIANFEQRERESDIDYAFRKVEKFRELLQDRDCLIIVDGINIEFEKIKDKQLFIELYELNNCDIIFSTRANQESYSDIQLNIDHLDEDVLVDIYRQHCPVMDDQVDSIKELTKLVGYHTLIVELISKYAKNSCHTPEEMLAELKGGGVLSLDKESVKWNLEEDTVHNLIKKIFDVSGLSIEQKRLLLKAAFLPENGITEKIFKDCFKVKTNKEIRYLIDNGWLSDQYINEPYLSVHPLIAKVIIDTSINDELLDEYYRELILIAYKMRNKIAFRLYFQLFICTAMKSMDCEILNESFADYLVLLSELMINGYDLNKVKSFSKEAIKIYNGLYIEEDYNARRELAWLDYAYSIAEINKEESLNLCKEHLKKASKKRDNYLKLKWMLQEYVFNLNYKYESKDSDSGLLLTALKVSFAFATNTKKVNNKKLFETLNYGFLAQFSDDFAKNIFDEYCKIFESEDAYDVFFCHETEYNRFDYKVANKLRKIIQISNNDKIRLKINAAKIDILNNRYNEAEEILLQLCNSYIRKSNAGTLESMMILRMLGALSFTVKSYKKSREYFEYIIKITESFGIQENPYDYIFLSRTYIFLGDYKKAEKIHKIISLRIQKNIPYNINILEAELYYNKGLMLIAKDKPEEARTQFVKSSNSFYDCPIKNEVVYLGYARCSYQLALIEQCKDRLMKNRLSTAQKYYELSVGKNHPEYIEFSEFRKRINNT